ncbi:MAG TPA: gamma-glutamyltransferase, partial [Candidatus Acidoferrum sp.]|nr:gamma-glutamyltransferase [Candidatus Acidoferrum sp.]
VHAQELAAFPATARTYLRQGHYIHRPPTIGEGDRVVSPDLARSLDLIAREGSGAFYKGAIAQALHEEMQSHGGFLTLKDLADYSVRVQPALLGKYRGLELAFSPGATGGITSLEMLNILSAFPSNEVGFSTTNGLHLRAEASRRAFQDRLSYLGDPARVEAPWDSLASQEYGAEVARGIQARGPRSKRLAPDPSQFKKKSDRPGRPPTGKRHLGDCTTHIGVVDRQRNMVSLTHTAVSIFGSRVVGPGTGILLSNGMLWFDPEPGRPNSVGPGKRALVNMVPVLAFRRGEPHLTLGAPGGRKIISAIPQVLSNLADLKLTPQAAIEAPRLHSEGDDLWVDERVGERALAALGKMGHRVVTRQETPSTLYFSRPVAIRVSRKGLQAGLDPLRAAAASGF